MEIKRIYLMFKSHFDIGFTMLAEDIVRYYAGDMLDRVFATCDATKDMGNLRYVWTMPAWPLQKIRQMVTGERKEKLDAMIRSGQISWHALPYTSHYDACGVEDAIRGLEFSRQLSEEFGVPLHTAGKLTDVPGQGRLLPEILSGAGIEFLHIGVNDFAMPPEVPRIFRWQAPSGRSIVTMLNSGYGTDLMPPEDWPYSTWIAILSTVDNSGPQTAEIVDEMVGKIRKRYPKAEICCASLETAWQALREEDLSGLPLVTEDLADTWIHGIASYPKETALVRRLRGRLNRAENALLNAPEDAVQRADQAIRNAYAAVNLYTEHTWGLDVKTWLGRIPDYDAFDAYRASSDACALMEKSWEEQRARAHEAERYCALAEETLGISRGKQECTPEKWIPLKGEKNAENARWRILFSADTGRVHSVTDLRNGRIILQETDGHSAISYRHDVYGAEEMTDYLRNYAFRYYNWGIDDNSRIAYPAFCTHQENNPTLKACEQCGEKIRFTFEGHPEDGDAQQIVLTLDLSGERLRISLGIQGKKATAYVESGALCFDFAAHAPGFYINKPGSVLRPETDIAGSANHAFYALESFAGVEDGKEIYAVVSQDAPLVSIGENGVYAFRRTYEAHQPELRFNLLNTMWGTNFPQWIEGDFTFEFELISGQDADAVYRTAQECTEGVQTHGLALPEGLRIAGVQAEEKSFLVHVRNMTSRCISFDAPPAMTQTDLMGRTVPQDPVIRPYEVRAYRLNRD